MASKSPPRGSVAISTDDQGEFANPQLAKPRCGSRDVNRPKRQRMPAASSLPEGAANGGISNPVMAPESATNDTEAVNDPSAESVVAAS